MTTTTTSMFSGFESLARLRLFIQRADVLRMYSGKGGCMCGCKGRYYTTKTAPEKERESASVNETQVARIIDELVDRADQGAEFEVMDGLCGERIVYLETETGRVYAAYLRAGSEVFS